MSEVGHDTKNAPAIAQLRAEFARLLPEAVFPHSRRELIEKNFEDFLAERTADAQARCLSETERVLMLDLNIQKHLRDEILEAVGRLCLMHLVH